MPGKCKVISRYAIQGVLFLSLFVPGLLMAQQLPYAQMVVQADGCYARQDYQAALKQYFQLIDQFPEGGCRDLTFYHFACCCIKLNKIPEAMAAFEELCRQYPDSPYAGEALPQLMQIYLAVNAPQKAEGIWNIAFTRWAETSAMWGVVKVYYQYLAQQAPQHVLDRSELLTGLNFDANVLLGSVYRPLMEAGRFTEAKALHEHLQFVMKEQKLCLLNEEQQAYDQGLTGETIDTLFTRFKEALDNGDQTTAQKWLATLNNIAPEHPRAVEARQLFKDKK